MSADELLSIGRFASLSGLSIHTLRHWGDVGLLVPVAVDDVTRYRRYAHSQLERASRIAELRGLDVPLDEIHLLLAADTTPDLVAEVLGHHRRRLADQAELIAARLHRLDHTLEEQTAMSNDVRPISACRPLQVRIAVDDLDATVAFYEQTLAVASRAQPGDHSTTRMLAFGDWADHNVMAVVFVDDADDVDRPSASSTIGFVVDDVDRAHQRALDAGGRQLVAPHDPDDHVRCSAVADPSGNWVWLEAHR